MIKFLKKAWKFYCKIEDLKVEAQIGLDRDWETIVNNSISK